MMALEPMPQGARIDVTLSDDEYWRPGTVIDAPAFRVRLDSGRVVDGQVIVGWMPHKTLDEKRSELTR
jgi:hypothetical protein